MYRKINLIILISMVLVFIFSGCGHERTAPPIVLPDIEKIENIEITKTDGAIVSFDDKEQIEQFMSVLTQATPTSLQSVQDYPQVDKCGEIDISNNDGITTVYYYEKRNKHYLEQPYRGIYEITVDIDGFVSDLTPQE